MEELFVELLHSKTIERSLNGSIYKFFTNTGKVAKTKQMNTRQTPLFV